MIERFLTVKQVAEIMHCSLKTAYNMIYTKMPYLQWPLRVSERALKQYIEDNTVYPARARRRAS